jgi:hypothetical protein
MKNSEKMNIQKQYFGSPTGVEVIAVDGEPPTIHSSRQHFYEPSQLPQWPSTPATEFIATTVVWGHRKSVLVK